MHDPSLQAVRRAAAFESTVLENGLTVRVHTMPGFTGVHAVYGTKFGSIDRAFALDGKRVDLPAGIAHFLEHKMFENEEGDAFTFGYSAGLCLPAVFYGGNRGKGTGHHRAGDQAV